MPRTSSKLSGKFLSEIAASGTRYTLPKNARAETARFADGALGLLFPHFAVKPNGSLDEIEEHAERLEQDLVRLLRSFVKQCRCPAEEVAGSFFESLPSIYEALMQDAEAIFDGDPAAESLDEVILAYPGFFAIAIYRIAHHFHVEGVEVFPRLLTEFAHQKTGVDIHPAAIIGKRFMIDHGTGVVIGATSVIGDNVKVYQGVTLGAALVQKDLASVKRHPTIEDNVVIYSNATILGGKTVVGRDSVIGGNVWLTESVAPGSLVTRRSEVRVRSAGGDDDLEFNI